MRGKRARLDAALVCAATAGPAVLALVACERQVLRLLPEQGREAGTPRALPDARAGCEQNSQCDWPVPYCEVSTGRCVGCLESADCDGTERCDVASMRCVLPCTRENDCRSSQNSEAYRCDQNRGFCVECLDDADCSSRYPHYCEPESGRCIDCDTEGCGSGRP